MKVKPLTPEKMGIAAANLCDREWDNIKYTENLPDWLKGRFVQLDRIINGTFSLFLVLLHRVYCTIYPFCQYSVIINQELSVGVEYLHSVPSGVKGIIFVTLQNTCNHDNRKIFENN